jgi:glycerol-3-phosphate O-acyltransferase
MNAADNSAISSSSNGSTAVADTLTNATAAMPAISSTVPTVTQHNTTTAPRWNVESLNEGVSASTLAQIREFARIQANRDVELTRLRNEVCHHFTVFVYYYEVLLICIALDCLKCCLVITGGCLRNQVTNVIYK